MTKIVSLRLVKTAAIALALLIGAAHAGDPPQTPTTPPEGVHMVDADGVQKFQAAGAILVDARKAAEYADGSLKGAISVPYDPEVSAKAVDFDAAKDKYDLSAIPDKDKTYVVFCNASTCWKSFKLVTVMARAGYKNLHWYRNGFPDWKARNLPIE
ncbi:MAG: rhodanese [Magnetococcales bacterium]|nr:rhodanese [Magnetococcales bacterium]